MKLKVGQVWIDEDGYTREITGLNDNLVTYKVENGPEFFNTINGFREICKNYKTRLSKKHIINEFFDESQG